jgi:hypothetical protein
MSRLNEISAASVEAEARRRRDVRRFMGGGIVRCYGAGIASEWAWREGEELGV